MLYIILFSAELFILFLLAKRVHKRLGSFLIHITKNTKLTVYIMAILFLPGTFVHEMAHFLMALLLLVPVGNMELMPRMEEGGIKLGSVSIAKTDPVRRFLIGIAPFLLGTAIILSIAYYFAPKGLDAGIWITILAGYLIFTISNTMFSSKRDMEGSWILLVILSFVLLLFWIFDVHISVNFDENVLLGSIMAKANVFLIIPGLLDMIMLISLKNYGRS